MKKKTFPRAVAYAVCAIFALTTAALAQNVQVNHDSKDSKAPDHAGERAARALPVGSRVHVGI